MCHLVGSAPEDARRIRADLSQQRLDTRARSHRVVSPPAPIAVTAVERPAPDARIEAQLGDLDARPVRTDQLGVPRRAPFGDRDRVAATRALDPHVVAKLRGNPRLAETLDGAHCDLTCVGRHGVKLAPLPPTGEASTAEGFRRRGRRRYSHTEGGLARCLHWAQPCTRARIARNRGTTVPDERRHPTGISMPPPMANLLLVAHEVSQQQPKGQQPPRCSRANLQALPRVEPTGIEPVTSCLQSRRSPS
jgi:hypothetical protein